MIIPTELKGEELVLWAATEAVFEGFVKWSQAAGKADIAATDSLMSALRVYRVLLPDPRPMDRYLP